MDFNVTENKMFTDMVPDFILQLTLNKLLLIEFWYRIKKIIHDFLKKLLKYLFLLQLQTYIFSSYTSPENVMQQIDSRSRYDNLAAFY